MISIGRIQEIRRGKYEYIISPLTYFETPFFERPKKKYNPDFLNNYIPNISSFLRVQDTDKLLHTSHGSTINTNYYRENRRSLENLLIDMSYASSRLEWNTYSYLDTEVLINFNEVAEDKQKDETQMILNHKKAIEYMVYYKKEMKYESKSFFELHSLLWMGLLPKQDLWKIREKIVEIGRSQYTPIENPSILKEQFEIFIEKLNQIKNPFEQSLFILVFIPYFQIFMDINKRTSRISANMPLIKKWLAPISLLQVKERDYINAVLAIYELNDPTFMRDIFVENYILNFKRYI